MEQVTDTRETIEAKLHYAYFDACIDAAQRGECSVEDAVTRYQRLIGGVAIEAASTEAAC
jgi:hypothetical protein